MDRDLINRIAESLRQLMESGGRPAVLNEQRVAGKLADRHNRETAARKVVVDALRLGVPTRLMEADPVLIAPALTRETERLCRELGADSALASGAVTVWALTLGIPVAEDERTSEKAGPAPANRKVLYIGLGCLVLAIAAWWAYGAHQPAVPAYNPDDPLTWPISPSYAALWKRETCPQGWKTTDVGCVHAGRDLGSLAQVEGHSVPWNSFPYFGVLFLDVMPKDGPCPTGTAFQSVQYCLVEVPLPSETTVILASKVANEGCDASSRLDVPLRGYCLMRPKSPALREPWHRATANSRILDSPFYPSTLRVQRRQLLCPSNAILENDVGYCLLE